MNPIELNFTVDLAKKETQVVRDLNSPLYYGDMNAHTLNITILRNGEPEDLSDVTPYGYIVFESTGDTVELADSSSKSGNVVSVTLTDEAYAVTGRAYIVVQLAKTGTRATVFAVYCWIGLGVTDSIIVPSGSRLDIDSLTSKIDEFDQKISDVQNLVDDMQDAVASVNDAVKIGEMSEEYLLRLLLGNDDDWSVANYDSMSYSATKTRRIITYKGNSNSNSGFQSVNLTGVPGAPHTVRSGNFSNITLADTDFVPIPSILKFISNQSAAYPVTLFLSGQMHYDRYNDDGHAGFSFDYVLRRYNAESGTYEYTPRTTTSLGLISTATTANGVDKISIAQLIPDGRGGDYVVKWDEWEEMAIFATRRNRMFSGTMLLVPSLEIYGDKKPVAYNSPQSLANDEQAQARENIGAGVPVSGDDAIELDLSDSAGVYSFGDVGATIGYKTSAVTTTYKRAAYVTKGCKYVLSVVNSDTPASTTLRTSRVVSLDGTILQIINTVTVAGATNDTAFISDADGFLYPSVDANALSLRMVGGPLYGMKEDLLAATAKKDPEIDFRWSIGTINSETGDASDANNRIRTYGYTFTYSDTIFVLKPGYGYGISGRHYTFTQTGVVQYSEQVGVASWDGAESTFVLPAGDCVRFVVRKLDNSDITLDDANNVEIIQLSQAGGSKSVFERTASSVSIATNGSVNMMEYGQDYEDFWTYDKAVLKVGKHWNRAVLSGRYPGNGYRYISLSGDKLVVSPQTELISDLIDGCHIVCKANRRYRQWYRIVSGTSRNTSSNATQMRMFSRSVGATGTPISYSGTDNVNYLISRSLYPLTQDTNPSDDKPYYRNAFQTPGYVAVEVPITVEEGEVFANTYEAGEYFAHAQVLYKATSAINAGDTIAVGENCEATSPVGEGMREYIGERAYPIYLIDRVMNYAQDTIIGFGMYARTAHIFNDLVLEWGAEPLDEFIYTDSVVNIVAEPDCRYRCYNPITELTFTPSSYGLCEVVFTTGSSPAEPVLPSTVRMPDWWTGVEANRTYDIMVLNGTLGMVTSWAT